MQYSELSKMILCNNKNLISLSSNKISISSESNHINRKFNKNKMQTNTSTRKRIHIRRNKHLVQIPKSQ